MKFSPRARFFTGIVLAALVTNAWSSPPKFHSTPKVVRLYAEGTISIGSGVSGAAFSNKVLFIIARATKDGKTIKGVAPIAFQRIESPVFPLKFSLTNADNMVGEIFYEGDFTLVVRLDADGLANALQSEDVEISKLVRGKESRKIKLVLSK